MNFFKNILILVSAVVLISCTSNVKTKTDLQNEEYNNSISNPKNTPTIYDVNTRFLTDDETRTIYEVFTGKEFGHGKLILRTDNNDRTGLYFYVMFETFKYNILKGSKISLYFQTNKSSKNYSFSYTIPETSSLFRELVLGVTGKDAKGIDENVLAWKIEVKSPEDKMITMKQSWLWSVDDSPKPEASTSPDDKRPTLYLPNINKNKKK